MCIARSFSTFSRFLLVGVEVETADWARRVLRAVDTLPQPLHEVVRLRYWADMSTRQIAREVAASQTSIMRLLDQAATALKTALQGLRDADNGSGAAPPSQRGCR